MTVSFSIATSGRIGPRRWWLVRIHDDLPSLRRAAAAYDPGADLSACYGCCQSKYGADAAGGRHYSPGGYAGVIRLATTHLTSEIIAHELVHAACQTYRMNVDVDVRLGPAVTNQEENLAYLYGELFADFSRRFEHPLATACATVAAARAGRQEGL